MAATILWGDQEVPVLERGWQGQTKPYHYVNRLKPGQKWSDAVVSSNPQNRPATECYIQQPEGFVPPAVLAARELLAEGASLAVWTDCWSGRAVFMSADLVCVAASTGNLLETPPEIGDNELWEILQKIKAAMANRWSGLPDAIALFSDGRIVMRDMKVAGKDKLQETQHAFARIARNLFPGRIEFGVVEWGRRPRRIRPNQPLQPTAGRSDE
jgi:hypothetical protein